MQTSKHVIVPTSGAVFTTLGAWKIFHVCMKCEASLKVCFTMALTALGFGNLWALESLCQCTDTAWGGSLSHLRWSKLHFHWARTAPCSDTVFNKIPKIMATTWTVLDTCNKIMLLSKTSCCMAHQGMQPGWLTRTVAGFQGWRLTTSGSPHFGLPVRLFVRCPERETNRVPLRSSHWVQQHKWHLNISQWHQMTTIFWQTMEPSEMMQNSPHGFRASNPGIKSMRDDVSHTPRHTTTSLRPLASCRSLKTS